MMVVCEFCNGMDYICDSCQEADGDCLCEYGPSLVLCPDCNGYGEDEEKDDDDDDDLDDE